MADKNNEATSSWTTVIWMAVVALIGFGFAAYRYMQFSHLTEGADHLRITRIELYIYRATGPWGLVAVFLLMGLFGLYYTIWHIREINRKP